MLLIYLSYISRIRPIYYIFFFFNDTATTEIYTLSLHDALPILYGVSPALALLVICLTQCVRWWRRTPSSTQAQDRKSTRLNSSHPSISYAVFCLKKKKNTDTI